MDLTYSRFEHVGAADFAVLMVIVTARQGGSPSARRQAALATPQAARTGLLAPLSGAFSPAVAATLRAAAEE